MSHAFALHTVFLCYNGTCKTGNQIRTETEPSPPNCLTPSTTEVQRTVSANVIRSLFSLKKIRKTGDKNVGYNI